MGNKRVRRNKWGRKRGRMIMLFLFCRWSVCGGMRGFLIPVFDIYHNGRTPLPSTIVGIAQSLDKVSSMPASIVNLNIFTHLLLQGWKVFQNWYEVLGCYLNPEIRNPKMRVPVTPRLSGLFFLVIDCIGRYLGCSLQIIWIVGYFDIGCCFFFALDQGGEMATTFGWYGTSNKAERSK